METIDAQDQQAIAQLLSRARERLDVLSAELREFDGELDGLSTERHQYRLVHEACRALEELAEVGGSELFWGEGLASGEGTHETLRLARSRLDVFEKRIAEIEERRQPILDAIRVQEENIEILEEDLHEARFREEQRKQEWVIEREIGPLPHLSSVMPWTRGGEDDDRFRKALAAALLLSLLFGLLLPMIHLPVPERWEAGEVPERLTKLIREEKPPPPPPVQEQTRPEEMEPDPTEEQPLVAEETPPKPSAEPAPTPGAESKGLLAFRENFAGLADEPAARLGADARISNGGEMAAGMPQRSMVTSQAPGSSGGINLSSLSRDVGGGGDQIAGVQVARATSSIGGIQGEDRPRAGGATAGRTDEEIQIVFDRHKAALYRLYNRQLRKNPTLRGQIVLRLRIEPDGSVSLCEVQGSDMKAPQLAAQVAARVKTFDFGAKEGIAPVTILYPIDFLPAT